MGKDLLNSPQGNHTKAMGAAHRIWMLKELFTQKELNL
jgi:hypothetical protein